MREWRAEGNMIALETIMMSIFMGGLGVALLAATAYGLTYWYTCGIVCGP